MSRDPDRVLVVEDDDTIADVVTRYLIREGYVVDRAADGPGALERVRAAPPDVVILDLMLPGLDGVEVCRRLRADAAVPIIMLTARTSEEDRILGLDAGADDYVTKPFSPRELMARVRAALRRARTPAPDDPSGAGRIVADELEIDTAAREVRVAGELVDLTALEHDLLVYLARHPRQVLNREQLLEGVWGSRFGETSTVTVTVSRLRDKLEAAPGTPRWIQTVYGVGYRFDP